MFSFIKLYRAEFRRQKQVADLGIAVTRRWGACGELRHLAPNELVHLGYVWANAFRTSLEIHQCAEKAEKAANLSVAAVLGLEKIIVLDGRPSWAAALVCE